MRTIVGALALLSALAGAANAGEKLLVSKSGIGELGGIVSGALPGAGAYRFEVTASEDAELWIDARYETHWDVFLAPPPRPHDEFIAGNEGSDVYEQYMVIGKYLSANFVVPETRYTFFTNQGEYSMYGVPMGAAMYREDKAEFPWFSMNVVSQLPYQPFDYTLSLYQTGVPEPAAWALMIIGLGLAGASLRRQPQLA